MTTAQNEGDLIAADRLEERGLTYLAQWLRGEATMPDWLTNILAQGGVDHGIPFNFTSELNLQMSTGSFGPLHVGGIEYGSHEPRPYGLWHPTTITLTLDTSGASWHKPI